MSCQGTQIRTHTTSGPTEVLNAAVWTDVVEYHCTEAVILEHRFCCTCPLLLHGLCFVSFGSGLPFDHFAISLWLRLCCVTFGSVPIVGYLAFCEVVICAIPHMAGGIGRSDSILVWILAAATWLAVTSCSRYYKTDLYVVRYTESLVSSGLWIFCRLPQRTPCQQRHSTDGAPSASSVLAQNGVFT